MSYSCQTPCPKAQIEDDFYNENFEELFYESDWIYDFQKNTMLWW